MVPLKYQTLYWQDKTNGQLYTGEDADEQQHAISYLPASLSRKASSKDKPSPPPAPEQLEAPRRVRVYQRREGSGGVVREAIDRLEQVAAASTGSASPERMLSGEHGSPLARQVSGASADHGSPLGRKFSSEQNGASPLGRKPSYGLTGEDRTISRTSEDSRINAIHPTTPGLLEPSKTSVLTWPSDFHLADSPYLLLQTSRPGP